MSVDAFKTVVLINNPDLGKYFKREYIFDNDAERLLFEKLIAVDNHIKYMGWTQLNIETAQSAWENLKSLM